MHAIVFNSRSAVLVLVVFLFRTMDAFSHPANSSSAPKINGSWRPTIRPLPERLLIGYATECDGKVVKAVQQGLNVIIWSFMEIHEAKNADGKDIKIEWNSLDFECIKNKIDLLDRQGYDDTIHLVSFGGWNGPHLDANLSAQEWFQAWRASAGKIFHGIDWDLEGHDDLDSPTNVFTIDCLEKMGCISRLAKEDGYIIGMAPPQSYLDTESSRFSRAVNLAEPQREWHAEFHYFGANVYTYMMAKYADYIDFCSIQFYESYSRAAMAIYGPTKQTADQYLETYVRNLIANEECFFVDFGQDPSLNLSSQNVPLPLSKLVLGFANGWALETGDKALYIEPKAIAKAYSNLESNGIAPRGLMFWVVGEEGKNGIEYAPALNAIVRIRTKAQSVEGGEEL